MSKNINSPLMLGLKELATAIAKKEYKVSDVIDQTIQRIQTYDATLHAFCLVDIDSAMEQAESLDRQIKAGASVGPLAGIPVAVKDLICTKNLRTTFGSQLYSDFVPEEDDIVVERLKAAGAIIIGKTNTSEFGYGAVGHNKIYPTTKNPWNTELTPGGSSAGSAVAVAAKMVPLALGSDGGGSIRIPASLTGVFGMKPSWGRVPLYPSCRDERYPGQSGWESLEHIGPITRNAADAAFALATISGPSHYDRHSIPVESYDWSLRGIDTLQHCRFAYTTDLGFAVVEPEIIAAIEDAIDRLKGILGNIECTFPPIGNNENLLDTIVAMETDRSGLRTMAADKGIKLDGWLGSILERTWTGDQFTNAILERKRIVNITAKFMKDYDFLITPTTATAAFPINLYGPLHIAGKTLPPSAWVPFSALANFTGLPAASVPIGFTKDGRPIGLQIMGRHLDDRGVLALSAVIESLFQNDKWPNINTIIP
ncbi:amidase [Serratia proteamaculans]|uniref:amidase n=1 Tax=Serratia proteamaculans TaxID=28151 RepID=UPI002177465F|nr:amidase [Serratia proteamaculans]CAI1866161.1 Glutamyl-tRNA(Gln) amidotransferase subunit A [Serratia proteamaculans]